jgi:hypothetical protein
MFLSRTNHSVRGHMLATRDPLLNLLEFSREKDTKTTFQCTRQYLLTVRGLQMFQCEWNNVSSALSVLVTVNRVAMIVLIAGLIVKSILFNHSRRAYSVVHVIRDMLSLKCLLGGKMDVQKLQAPPIRMFVNVTHRALLRKSDKSDFGENSSRVHFSWCVVKYYNFERRKTSANFKFKFLTQRVKNKYAKFQNY